MSNRLVYLLAALFAAAGLSLVAVKTLFLGYALSPGAAPENWQVEAKVSFRANGGPAVLSIYLPRNTADRTVLDQTFVSPGYTLNIDGALGGRMAQLATPKAKGDQAVYLRFIIHRAGVGGDAAGEPEPPIPAPWSGRRQETAQKILAEAATAGGSPEATATAVLRILGSETVSPAVLDLMGGKQLPDRIAVTAGALLSLAGFPAHAVHGVDLAEEKNPRKFHHWLAIKVDGTWRQRALDPAKPAVPKSWFPWWRGAERFAAVEGGKGVRVRITLDPATETTLVDTLALGQPERRSLLTAPIASLPLEVQSVYRVLMVVPLGVLLLVVMRNLVGFRSFGTFMPVLIALAFRSTHLLWGIALFVTIVSIGLVIRLWMERLRLLVVPRLAAVLIVVIGSMAGLSVLSHQLGLQGGLSVALFPMVILTMTVERMSVIWDERGPREALQQGVGSLAIASLCHLVMANRVSEYLFFTFPELLLVLFACVLMLGRYSGYRLTELIRFRPLAGSGPGAGA